MAEEEPAGNPPKRAITGQTFKWAVIVVSGFTLLAFLTHIALVSFGNPLSEAVKQLIENCENIYQAGFAVFLGLIGGKAAQ